MAFQDILLHIQGGVDQTPEAGIDAALAIAAAMHARMSALAVELDVAYMPHLLDQLMGLKGIAEEAERRSAQGCRERLDHFRACAVEAGIPHDAHVVSADLGLEALWRARESRTYDFSIYCPAAEGLDMVLAETLILLSGRPVLVLPEGHAGVLERIAVAWDGSAPAARAVNDALPLLRAARSVRILTVEGEKPADRYAPAAHAVRHLQRHGVQAEAEPTPAGDLSTAQALEQAVADKPTDLIVMGGFGHSRFQEIVLGGVTEHMLTHTPTAVWFSH